jgi:hypothetical protein
MMWAKGFATEEVRAALSRATGLTAKSDFAERFAAAHLRRPSARSSPLREPKKPLLSRATSKTRCNLPFPHLLRGELLLKRDPRNPASAEETFQGALAIAREQGARSWGLRAALALARLYESTGRPADAATVLAPALGRFSPTPEMPEIAEAQALTERLA